MSHVLERIGKFSDSMNVFECAPEKHYAKHYQLIQSLNTFLW